MCLPRDTEKEAPVQTLSGLRPGARAGLCLQDRAVDTADTAASLFQVVSKACLHPKRLPSFPGNRHH